jgi:3-oxoadipate enol-lactonase
MNLRSAEEIARLIPGATFEIMEMTGHGSIFYRPDEFVRLISDFKARLQTS